MTRDTVRAAAPISSLRASGPADCPAPPFQLGAGIASSASELTLMLGSTESRQSKDVVAGKLTRSTACQMFSRFASEYDRSVTTDHTSPRHARLTPPAVSSLSSVY